MDNQNVQPNSSFVTVGLNTGKNLFYGLDDLVSMLRTTIRAGHNVADIAEVNSGSWKTVSVQRARYKEKMGEAQIAAEFKAAGLTLDD